MARLGLRISTKFIDFVRILRVAEVRDSDENPLMDVA